METAQTEARIEVGIDRIHLGPDSLLIYHPRYVDAARTRIRAIVRTPDGKLTEMEADRNDPRSALIRDLQLQYSEAEVEMFTHRETCVAQRMHELQKRMSEDRKKAEEREETFQAKSKALSLPQIRDHKDASVRRDIRRANSAFEVMALTVAALSRA